MLKIKKKTAEIKKALFYQIKKKPKKKKLFLIIFEPEIDFKNITPKSCWKYKKTAEI